MIKDNDSPIIKSRIITFMIKQKNSRTSKNQINFKPQNTYVIFNIILYIINEIHLSASTVSIRVVFKVAILVTRVRVSYSAFFFCLNI
ncbi:hypothetical protein pb186bvf_009811 [Paramecium bursaria]